MRPILFHIGSFPLRSWGLLLMIAFLMGAWRASKAAPRYGIKTDDLWDASLAGLFGGVLGGRLGYVVQNPGEYLSNPREILNFMSGGMTSFGGLIGGVAAGLAVCKKRGMNVWDAADVAAPSLAIGWFFGRLGCLLNGCCYGHKCDVAWKMNFYPDSHTQIIGVHPTQIYEAIGMVIAYAVLVALEKKRAFRGQIFAVFLGLYGLSRFIVEIAAAVAEAETSPAAETRSLETSA